jgi:DNA-binding transcriptional MocR family regulator
MKRNKITGKTAVRIADSIERIAHAGQYRPGDALPTIRSLAATLEVSPVTVADAYRSLRARGLAIAEGRRGTRIRPSRSASPVGRTAPALEQSPGGRAVIDLSAGNPDPALLPSLETALRHVPSASRLYGDEGHLRSLARFAAQDFAADGIPANAITIVGGTLDAIERILRERLRPGDRVAVEDPGFPPLFDLLAASGFPVEPVAVDDEGAMPDALAHALRRRVRALVITQRGQNPCGAAVSAARAAHLRAVLRKYRDVMLIEIDPVGPIAGVPAATVCDGTHPQWAVVRSTSKFLGPDLRVAVVAGDDLTIMRVQTRYVVGPGWVSHILQHMTLALWSDPSGGRFLSRAASIYAQRRTTLLNELAKQGIPAVGRSGFNVWIPSHDETAVVQALLGRGWSVAAGERFRVRAASGLRVTTSVLALEEAHRFAADLAACLRPMPVATA